MTEDSRQTIPWWQNGKVVTFLGSIIAAAMPLTTFVSGHIQKETELELNAQKQRHEIRMDYINRALMPNMKEAEKELIFGLFAEMDDQPALQRWGKQHHLSLISEIETLKEKIKSKEGQQLELENRVEGADKTIADLENTIAEQESNNAPSEKIVQLEKQLRSEREKAEAELAQLQELQKKTDALRVRVGKPMEDQVSSPLEPQQLVAKFVGPERKIASSELVELYNQTPQSVVRALIDGILPQSDFMSYRVNLYIAYTLANIPIGWHGSSQQKEKIQRLTSTRNFRDPAFKNRVTQALANYAGT